MDYYKTIEYKLDKYLGGHINITKNITVYGHNAMHWAINWHTKKYGYICFRLPFPIFNLNRPIWRPLYLYFSPNATPWAATFILGRTDRHKDKFLSKIRYKEFGHNFNTNKNYDRLLEINGIERDK